MSAPITIQNMDEATAKWIDEEAQRRGVSTEALVVELIHKGIDLERQESHPQTYHDLDALAGTWSEEEANEFLNAIADFEQVDEKLWR
ncbi:MAG: hypothetical protein V7641_1817 [Blastocatellia bacterium]